LPSWTLLAASARTSLEDAGKSGSSPASFRQFLLALDGECPADDGGSGGGLSAAKAELIFAGSNHTVARQIYQAQVPRTQRDLNMAGFPRPQVDTLETAQRANGRARDLRGRQIYFDHFVAVGAAHVLDVNLCGQWVTRMQPLG